MKGGKQLAHAYFPPTIIILCLSIVSGGKPIHRAKLPSENVVCFNKLLVYIISHLAIPMSFGHSISTVLEGRFYPFLIYKKYILDFMRIFH